MQPPTVEEIEALRAIERTMRAFVEKFDGQPEWLWAPATVQMVNEIKPLIRALDDLRQLTAA